MEHNKLCNYNWWRWQQKFNLFCYWVSCGNYSCWLLVLSTSHSEVDIAILALYCIKTVANLLRGPPGISDWSHAVISKSLLNAAGPAPAHLSSEIIVCLACCPTPEIKSQLDRTVLSLTVTMTETWSSHYWSADRSYLRSRFVLQHSSLIHSHRVECAIYVWDFQYNVYKMYICNSHSSISFFNWGHLSC